MVSNKKELYILTLVAFSLISTNCFNPKGGKIVKFLPPNGLHSEGRRITVPGVGEYLKKYGSEGWYCGLNDEVLLVHRITGDTNEISGLEVSDRFSSLRVKDAFIIAYYRATNQIEKEYEVFTKKTSRRDELAKEILIEIDKMNDEEIKVLNEKVYNVIP